MDKWISVSVMRPDCRCLAFTDTKDLVIRYRIIPKGLFNAVACDATHWMPLPEPPSRLEECDD